jgi:hypothetical protein
MKPGGKNTNKATEYPTQGKFYSESGELVFEGQPKIKRIGNASWPVVVCPEGFDHLHG